MESWKAGWRDEEEKREGGEIVNKLEKIIK